MTLKKYHSSSQFTNIFEALTSLNHLNSDLDHEVINSKIPTLFQYKDEPFIRLCKQELATKQCGGGVYL